MLYSLTKITQVAFAVNSNWRIRSNRRLKREVDKRQYSEFIALTHVTKYLFRYVNNQLIHLAVIHKTLSTHIYAQLFIDMTCYY